MKRFTQKRFVHNRPTKEQAFNVPHLCPDWDGMLLVPGAPEMEFCTCGPNGRPLRPGDNVKTKFLRDQYARTRTVKSCHPATFHTQTGWIIETEDNLSLDSAWYTEV